MSANRIPVESWPVGHFLAEEMQARGWTSEDVAARMGGETDHDRAVWRLTVELLIECSDVPIITLGVDTAQALGKAFDTSPDFWLNLHRQYVEWRDAKAELQRRDSQNG